MNRLLIILFFTSSLNVYSQTGTLFVKKGIRKKISYTVWDSIGLRLQDGSLRSGYITNLKNDTVFINGHPVEKRAIKQVLLKRRPKNKLPDVKTMALIAGGAALTSVGLAISDPQHKTEAIIAGPVIGFGPMFIKYIAKGSVRAVMRKKYRIGKRFYLHISDVPLVR